MSNEVLITNHLSEYSSEPPRSGGRNRVPGVIVASGDGLYRDALAKAVDQRRDVKIVGVAADERSTLKLCIEAGADLLVVDADLPGAGGFETAIQAREASPNLGILLIGDELDPNGASDLMSGGTSGVGILFRSALDNVDMLVQAISIVADGESVFEESLVRHIIAPSTVLKYGLTPREWEILGAIAEGCSNSAIADRLGIALRTVENRVGCIFTKLKLRNGTSRHSRVSAALRYLESGRSIRFTSKQIAISDNPAGLLIELDTAIN